MAERDFRELLEARWERGNFLCVGLDTDFEKIPESVRQGSVRETIVGFNRAIIDATKDLVCAFKPNPAFYEAEGVEGWNALKETIGYIREVAPQIPVILDAKRGDIGNTNEHYARMAFNVFEADAITVQPYQGGEALEPFLSRENKGVLVLVKTSNKASGEFQDLDIHGEPLFKIVARAVVKWNTKNNNCGVVVGTTYPADLSGVRAIVGDMPILMPGTGAQGGDLAASVKAGKSSNGGIIINASRSILFASNGGDFAAAARVEAQRLNDTIRAAI